MKIRTDFVTNSSSSSFALMIDIILKDGKHLTYDSGDFSSEYNGTIIMTASPKQVSQCQSVNELVDLIDQNLYTPRFDENNQEIHENPAGKEKFLKDISSHILSVDDIECVCMSGETVYPDGNEWTQEYIFNTGSNEYVQILNGGVQESEGGGGGMYLSDLHDACVSPESEIYSELQLRIACSNGTVYSFHKETKPGECLLVHFSPKQLGTCPDDETFIHMLSNLFTDQNNAPVLCKELAAVKAMEGIEYIFLQTRWCVAEEQMISESTGTFIRSVKEYVYYPQRSLYTHYSMGDQLYGNASVRSEKTSGVFNVFSDKGESVCVADLFDEERFRKDSKADETPEKHSISFPVIRSVEGTGYEGRTARIEYVNECDPLVLKTDWQSPYYSPAGIELFNSDNETLGYLAESNEPSLADLAEWLDHNEYTAKVFSVTPLSKRSKRAKYALMDVEIRPSGKVYFCDIHSPRSDQFIQNFEYEETEDGLVIKKTKFDADSEITIPQSIEGYPIISIAEGALDRVSAIDMEDYQGDLNPYTFKGLRALQKIDLPSGMKTIEEGLFQGCSNLKAVIVPDGVTSILDHSFQGCSSLEELVIPPSVSYIAENALDFERYQTVRVQLIQGSYSDLRFQELLKEYSSKNVYDVQWVMIEYINNFSEKEPVEYFILSEHIAADTPDGDEITDVLPEGDSDEAEEQFISEQKAEEESASGFIVEGTKLIKYTGSDSFVELPDDIETIGEYAFAGCNTVQKVIIPDSVNEIEMGVFSNCQNLKHVVFPFSDCTISVMMFSGCISLETIENHYFCSRIEEFAFSGCTSLKSFRIPENCGAIDYCAFDECSNLKELIIPCLDVEIDTGAFRGCSFDTVIVPEWTKKFQEAFQNNDIGRIEIRETEIDLDTLL